MHRDSLTIIAPSRWGRWERGWLEVVDWGWALGGWGTPRLLGATEDGEEEIPHTSHIWGKSLLSPPFKVKLRHEFGEQVGYKNFTPNLLANIETPKEQ